MIAPGSTAEDRDNFMRQAEQFRGQLFAHCCRMMRSVDDAEDVVQETYLRAWRAYDSFEGRSALRTWLFRIATNTCLTALSRRGRLPATDLADATALPALAPAGDPAEIVLLRDSTRLALMASLVYLTTRQRAVLILRDVLDWPAGEVAELLETTTAAVKSTLKRARARILNQAPMAEDMTEFVEPDRRALLARYLFAFQNSDAAALHTLLRQDANTAV